MCVGVIAGISALSLLESCASAKIIKKEILDEKISVSTSDFEAGKSYIIIRNNNLSFDILLNKNTDNSYKALLMQCTHYDNPVYASNKEIFCPSHGSTFDFNGNVKKEPATLPLKSYRTELLENTITIHLK